jgi:hypothetical protein
MSFRLILFFTTVMFHLHDVHGTATRLLCPLGHYRISAGICAACRQDGCGRHMQWTGCNPVSGVGICEPCAAGTQKLNAGLGACTLCPENEYKPSAGAWGCSRCPRTFAMCPHGMMWDETCNPLNGVGNCKPCPAATFKNAISTGTCAACRDKTCESGSEWANCNPLTGSPVCRPCSLGEFKAATGNGTCVSCNQYCEG